MLNTYGYPIAAAVAFVEDKRLYNMVWYCLLIDV